MNLKRYRSIQHNISTPKITELYVMVEIDLMIDTTTRKKLRMDV